METSLRDNTRYINQPTKALVEGIAGIIEEKKAFKNNPDVQSAFAAFKEVSTKAPAAIPYVLSRIDPAHPEKRLTRKQLELIMAAMIFRSSSTYSAIPIVVARLKAVHKDKEAAIIQENAREEIGDKTHRPHSSLLYDTFCIMGHVLGLGHIPGSYDATPLRFPSPSSYALARYLYRRRAQREDQPLEEAVIHWQGPVGYRYEAGSDEGFEELKKGGILQPSHRLGIEEPKDGEPDPRFLAPLRKQGILIPDHWGDHQLGIETAAYICNLAPASIADYHNEVMKTLGWDEYDRHVPATVNPNKVEPLAVGLLMLAEREASSVDDFSTGQLSYIGMWTEVINAYLGRINDFEQRYRDDDGLQQFFIGLLTPEFFEYKSREEVNEDRKRKDTFKRICYQTDYWRPYLGTPSPTYPFLTKRVTAWSRAHNDAQEARTRGHETISGAEEIHARDAREIALAELEELSPKALAATLREVTRLSQLRLKFWDDVLDRLKELEPQCGIPLNEQLDLKPAVYKPPAPPPQKPWLKNAALGVGIGTAFGTGILARGCIDDMATPYRATSRPDARLYVPNAVRALWERDPEALNDPEKLAEAWGKKLQKADGKIIPDQLICSYSYSDAQGKKTSQNIRTGDGYREDIARLKALLEYAAIERSPERAR